MINNCFFFLVIEITKHGVKMEIEYDHFPTKETYVNSLKSFQKTYSKPIPPSPYSQKAFSYKSDLRIETTDQKTFPTRSIK
jgi:hypothetical protein